jgi:uncharacterized protein
VNRLRLTADQFHDLAAGYGDPAGVSVLTAGQVSRRMLLVGAVVAQADARGLRRAARLDEAVDLLTAARRRAPERVRWVLGHPYLAAWAHRCLRLLDSPGTAPVLPDLAHLHAVAAAAATRAGLPFEVVLPARDGVLALPTLGAAYGLGDGPVRVTGGADGLVLAGAAGRVGVPDPAAVEPLCADVPDPAGGGTGWAARRVVDLPGLSLTVEDVDPYRDCYPWPPRRRLTGVEAARLAGLLAGAWRVVDADHPRHARVIRVALRSVVPVTGPDGGDRAVSAASRLAYGSVAVSVPEDPVTLALLLVHEVQHMKLGGLLDLVPLHRDDGVARHHAPWRADPRPVEALLQGTYAHLGVADFWRVRRRHEQGPAARRADFEYAYWSTQAARAAHTLRGCETLTDRGRVFVDGMLSTLDGWRDEPVPAGVAGVVRELTTASAVRWRLANLRPGNDTVAALVGAWEQGRPAAVPDGAPAVAAAPAGPAVPGVLAGLLRDRLLDGDGAGHAGADRAYLAGDLVAAVAGFRDRLVTDPADDEAWAGLTLALSAAGHPGAACLIARPELVRAVYAGLAGRGHRPEPAEVARWLTTHPSSPPAHSAPGCRTPRGPLG